MNSYWNIIMKSFVIFVFSFVTLGIVGTNAFAEFSADTPSENFSSTLDFESLSNVVFPPSDSGPLDIAVDEDELTVQFGKYTEFELQLSRPVTQSVQWDVQGDDLPTGIFLEETNSASVLIFGTPKFTDRWCTVVKATLENGPTAIRELCFQSADNEELVYPRFEVLSVLDSIKVANAFRKVLSYTIPEQLLEPSDPNLPPLTPISGDLDRGDLPADVLLEYQPTDSRFLVYGKGTSANVHRFSVFLNRGDEVLNSRQHQLAMTPKDPEYSCPPGYSFDENLGYCVQDRQNLCPDGTYYEPEGDSCVQYPQPPPTLSCREGYYYDHYLDRCVRLGHRRCPSGFYYDSNYERCVRDRNYCPVGFRYDWSLNRCVRWGHHDRCPAGFYYDSSRNRCVRTPASCRPGSHWDYSRERCVPNRFTCPPGEHFEPGVSRCVPDHRRCPPGFRWDPRDARCERIVIPPRLCPDGSRWSNSENRCIPFGPRPMPMPPMGMPMPPMPPDDPRPPMPPMPPMDGPGPGPGPMPPRPPMGMGN